ncbi:MAG: hypothetical protein ACTH8J_17550 [Specibacter sp.]
MNINAVIGLDGISVAGGEMGMNISMQVRASRIQDKTPVMVLDGSGVHLGFTCMPPERRLGDTFHK